MPHTPFFPQLRSQLAAFGSRVRQVRQQSLLRLDQLFGSFLPPGLLSQADEGANSRDRIYNVRLTFFAFLHQVLNPDCPCREVVRQVQALFALQEPGASRKVTEGTGAYCQARGRLPLDSLRQLREGAGVAADKAAALWHGFVVKLIDGTSTSLPDTEENQQSYPQPGGQKPGCGFPLLKLVGCSAWVRALCWIMPKAINTSMNCVCCNGCSIRSSRAIWWWRIGDSAVTC